MVTETTILIILLSSSLALGQLQGGNTQTGRVFWEFHDGMEKWTGRDWDEWWNNMELQFGEAEQTGPEWNQSIGDASNTAAGAGRTFDVGEGNNGRQNYRQGNGNLNQGNPRGNFGQGVGNGNGNFGDGNPGGNFGNGQGNYYAGQGNTGNNFRQGNPGDNFGQRNAKNNGNINRNVNRNRRQGNGDGNTDASQRIAPRGNANTGGGNGGGLRRSLIKKNSVNIGSNRP